MKPELRIGVVDSGHGPAQQSQVVAGRRFALLDEQLLHGELRDDPLGHGTAIIQAIAQRAPEAVFRARKCVWC